MIPLSDSPRVRLTVCPFLWVFLRWLTFRSVACVGKVLPIFVGAFSDKWEIWLSNFRLGKKWNESIVTLNTLISDTLIYVPNPIRVLCVFFVSLLWLYVSLFCRLLSCRGLRGKLLRLYLVNLQVPQLKMHLRIFSRYIPLLFCVSCLEAPQTNYD